MDEATLAASIESFILFLIFLGFFIWALKTGQFKNAEEAKYQMFRNGNKYSKKDEKPQEITKKEDEV